MSAERKDGVPIAPDIIVDDGNDIFSPIGFEDYFGLLAPEDVVVVRSYSEDDDDKILEELRPKYIVMYDPDPAFVRRIEVSRHSRECWTLAGAAADWVPLFARSGVPSRPRRAGRARLLSDVQGLCRGAALPQRNSQGEGRFRTPHSRTRSELLLSLSRSLNTAADALPPLTVSRAW